MVNGVATGRAYHSIELRSPPSLLRASNDKHVADRGTADALNMKRRERLACGRQQTERAALYQ